MCDAGIVLGAIGLTATVGGGIYSAYQQDKAAKRTARQTEELARKNQQAAETAAARALDRGAFEAGLLRQKGSRTAASQRAAFAAHGVDVTGGSAMQIQAESAYFGELDARTAALNAALEAWGYREQGATFSAQGAAQGAAQRRAGEVGAASTLLGTAGSAASSIGQTYYQYQLSKQLSAGKG